MDSRLPLPPPARLDRNLGFILLANSDAAESSAVTERILDTIATEDLLAHRRREPAPDLVARTEMAVRRLGPSWTEADHSDTFTDALRAHFGASEAVALGARIARDVGPCTQPPKADIVTDALDGELVFTCARGTLRASVRGTGTPVRLLGFKVDVTTPAEGEHLALARDLVLRMQSRDDAALATLLGSKAAALAQSRVLLKAGSEAGPCKVEGGDVSPWSHTASYRLSCRRTRAVLRVRRRESGSLDVLGIDVPTRCLR